MYKLILADDEAEIREGLKEVVPFEKLGFTVVAEAANGMEALGLCEQHEPDLLITDIRMPLLDGLSLCRRVRQSSPATQFIILSGYDDFEYARQAIEVKTMGYLLKPISSGEFCEALMQAKVSLDEEFRKRKDVTRLQAYFRESLPLLRETLLSSMLSGQVSEERMMESMEKYDIDLRAKGYIVAMIKIDERNHNCDIDDPELKIFAVKNILQEVLAEHAGDMRLQVFMHEGMLAVLFMLEDTSEEHYAQCVVYLEDARKTILHYLSCPLFIGVSTVFKGLKRISSCAKQALGALDQSVFSEQPQVLCITDIQPDSESQLVADDMMLRDLLNSIKAGESAQAQEVINEMMDLCRRHRPELRQWQAYLLEIFMCFMRAISQLSITRENLTEPIQHLSQTILNPYPSVDGAHAELLHFLQMLLDEVENHRVTSSQMISEQAQEYLRENYHKEDVTLEKLCLHLHISPSYFSTIFKKETKKTFHQYLTELRMDKAMTLLSTTEMKTAQIAQQCGLPDPSYFSYCFKKHFGFPPSKARKKS